MQAENEVMLRSLCSSIGGVIVPVNEAIELMSYFRTSAVLQRTTFRGTLQISTHMHIPVCLFGHVLSKLTLHILQVWSFLKTMEQKFPSLRKISAVALQGKRLVYSFFGL
jgi:hypothetical protein